MEFCSTTTTQNAGFELIMHPPYTPELAPSDFYLYLIVMMTGDNEFFEQGITMLEHRWKRCLRCVSGPIYVYAVHLYYIEGIT